MNHSDSGLAHGTNGAPQLTTENSEAERVAHDNEADIVELSTLIDELKQNNVKFKLADVLFVTRDKTGQIVWLEKGHPGAGLKHILDGDGETPGHAADFERAYGITRDKVPDFLREVVSHGEVISSVLKPVRGRMGFERVYSYRGMKYILAGIGTNGFIVSAYPVSD